jgi:Protein of unknown function (DUF3892)
MLRNKHWGSGQQHKATRSKQTVEINGVEYIKTVTDQTTKDNLDELPEF